MLQQAGYTIHPDVTIGAAFDAAHAHRYRLLLQLTDEHFTAAVINQQSRFVFLQQHKLKRGDVAQQLNKILLSDTTFFQDIYKSVILSVTSHKTTLIPAAFYNDRESKQMLTLNYSLEQKDTIIADYLRSFNLYNVFAIDKNIDEVFRAAFKNIKVLHSATPFMEGVHLQYHNIALPVLFVNISKNNMEVLISDGKNLLFYNNFHCDTNEDFLYYLLFVSEQLRLNPEVNPIILSGEVEKDDSLYTMTHAYFRHVGLADKPEHYEYDNEFEKIIPHTYFTLFNLALCE